MVFSNISAPKTKFLIARRNIIQSDRVLWFSHEELIAIAGVSMFGALHKSVLVMVDCLLLLKR